MNKMVWDNLCKIEEKCGYLALNVPPERLAAVKEIQNLAIEAKKNMEGGVS